MAFQNKELEDYWNEFQTLEADHHSDEDELSKTPDEGEIDADWLDAAGFSFVVNKFQDGRDLSDDELEIMTDTLTQAQAQAVRRRINALSTTLHRKKGNKLHVKEIFATSNDSKQLQQGEVSVSPLTTPSWQQYPPVIRQNSKQADQLKPFSFHKDAYSMSGVCSETSEVLEAGVASLGFRPHSRHGARSSHQFSRLSSISDVEVSLEFHLEESDTKAAQASSTTPDPHKVDLPVFEPKLDPLGVTLIGDLAECDMDKIKALAHIELAALFDHYNIIYSRPKQKKKLKENGIFGVSLQMLVEQDQKRTPGTKVPIVFKTMINFLEKEGLDSQGLLRMSSAETRVKQLRHDLEEKFYQGLFSWGDAGPHDVAVLLKQFLRELPVPLLSYNYLDAFPQVTNIPPALEQLKALNLLILMLTNEHRNTLKVLLQFLRKVVSHSNSNKMGLNNVAMIMAPNLLLAPSRNRKDKTDLEKELEKAAAISSVVKMLIHYQDVLWTVPPSFIAQLRYQYSREISRKNKVSKLPWRKDKDRSEIYKKMLPLNSDQFENQDGVIRVQAPHLTKSSTLIQLDQSTTAADVVAKFKLEDNLQKPDKLLESNRTIGKVETTNGHTFRNPKNAQYAHDTDYLYEVGGNITERCLDPCTKVLDLYFVNPLANWVIKKREARPCINFPLSH